MRGLKRSGGRLLTIAIITAGMLATVVPNVERVSAAAAASVSPSTGNKNVGTPFSIDLLLATGG